MTKKVTLRQSGDSISVTLPQEMVERLRLAAGDQVFVVETEQGLLLTPYDREFQKALRIYERGSWKYRNALRGLAR